MNDMYIFFDVDDTLYERSEPFIRAFSEMFPDHAALAEKAYRAFTKRGDEVFLPSQRGEITMEEMNLYRYTKGLGDVGITLEEDGIFELRCRYQKNQREIHLAKGIPETLDYCREHFQRIGIITNGPAQHQRDKIHDLGVEEWVDPSLILISGELKVDKPDPAIFRIAQERSGTDAGHLLYVGDSWEHDMKPAIQLGWKTIWLNKTGMEPGEKEPVPDLILRKGEYLRPDLVETFCS